jgi:peptidoglycan/LPS O-acetylase OafA/YrhL
MVALAPIPTSPDTKKPLLQKNKKGRYIFFDTLRGVAITAVIILHVIYLFPFESYPYVHEETLNAVNALLRFAVPFFLIASGILLSPPPHTPSGILAFYKRQFVRVGLPYLLVLSALLFLRSDFTMLEVFKNFFTGNASVPYYFITVLLQLYLIYPFIAHIATQRWFVYFALGFSLFSFFIPQVLVIHGVSTFFPYFFFFVWGIYMRPQILQGTVPRQYWPWISFLIFFLVGYMLLPGKYYNTLYFFGTSMFMLLYLLTIDNRIPSWFSKFFSFLGGFTLWIYLIHFPLLEIFLPNVFKIIPLGLPAFMYGSTASVIVSVGLAFYVSVVYEYSTKTFIKLFYTKKT